ncbi:peptidyl-prolyl cis-trans isomerase [Bifidobacterium animalis subsp. animalis MCC 1489]|uniref:DUF4190 domain-containing protein n=1 Tax=Bifidobacterium animalis subsp. animalis IM386 TaxID=1402194 RepID=A0AAV2W2H7_9BIFI|nr:hypothetical protein BANAN_02495 [Bifidobacterium animalis subsp. animalis ATCC 25527]AYN23355.1 hypothetical protein CNCMI4602_0495 [Bifidobacterium animalis subsp. animalis]KFI44305.1 hypothetical protein BASA_0570 [Bifidobacterium animalis subsp. animalis]KOA64151.1 peptidyl-prolyl cis-trans isomerase [Bifidobacterium animalis subsp. animalis MCC 1489]CDI67471.1 Uncharacterized protein BANIM336_00792 [Bifidobacterium animalis subsp. animalis IM386]
MRLCRAFLQYALHMTTNDTFGSPYSSPDPNEHGDNPYVGDLGYSQAPQQAYTAQYATPQPNYTQQYVPQPNYTQQYPPQGAYGYPMAAVDQWNGMCIAGFICSFFFPLVGLVLSIIALVQINKTGEKSRGMAIAGIVIGGISTALALIAIIMVICGLVIGLGALAETGWDNYEYHYDTHSDYSQFDEVGADYLAHIRSVDQLMKTV